MIKVLRMTVNRFDDLWIAMTNQSRHLPGSPVQHAMPKAVNDCPAFSMDDDLGVERRSCYTSVYVRS